MGEADDRTTRHGATRLLAIAGSVAIAACAPPAYAEQEDEQLWLQVNTNLPVAKDVRLTLEQIARFSDRQDGLYTTELGGLLSAKASSAIEFGFGYRWVAFHNGNRGADEHRLRQQMVATFGPLTTRLRIDERFHPGGGEIGFRVRPMIRYNHKLGGKGLSAFVSHESFLLANTTAWGQRAGYERMRNTAGLAFPLGRGLAADVGYLNQYRFGRGARDQMDHALNVQLTINLRDIVGPHLHD